MVEIVSYDPAMHDSGIPWFEKSLRFNAWRDSFLVVQENPVMNTARAFVCTVSKGGPNLFAAFAIRTALRHLDGWFHLQTTVREYLDIHCPNIDHNWHSNSRYLLPITHTGGVRLEESRDWRLRVDLAARTWTELATQFQVVRQPEWS